MENSQQSDTLKKTEVMTQEQFLDICTIMRDNSNLLGYILSNMVFELSERKDDTYLSHTFNELGDLAKSLIIVQREFIKTTADDELKSKLEEELGTNEAMLSSALEYLQKR